VLAATRQGSIAWGKKREVFLVIGLISSRMPMPPGWTELVRVCRDRAALEGVLEPDPLKHRRFEESRWGVGIVFEKPLDLAHRKLDRSGHTGWRRDGASFP